jgi:hypothetical protein
MLADWERFITLRRAANFRREWYPNSKRRAGARDVYVYIYIYIYVCMYIRMYVCMYVYTYYVLTKPPMPIYYVLAAVFASCFYVLKSLLHE